MSNDVKKFNKFYESKIQNVASKYLDFYYLENDISLTSLRVLYDLVDDDSYRAIATFAEQIEHFEDFDVVKIALLNYPPVRHTKRNFRIKFNELKEHQHIIDEVEFPWEKKYIKWGSDYWRNVVVSSIESGFKIRPMLELSKMKENEIKDTIEFLKSVGILSVVTSTGLIQEITTLELWQSVKHLFPRIFETKVVGVVTLSQINEFLESDIDLAATTISIASNYGMRDEDDDEWSLPTNY